MKNNWHIYIGLVHYPVYNKQKEVIITAVATVNIHDIARVAKTYELGGFFIINPLEDQHALVKRFLNHWLEGYGGKYNPLRIPPLKLVHCVYSLEEAIEYIKEKWKKLPKIIVTSARPHSNNIGYHKAKILINKKDNPFLILFGTAWGLTKDLISQADYVLKPIYGVGDYNHLSVRAAVAIILDRLLGGENGPHSDD
ncbi:MAG TPA: RNA methyltransferase [Candidatus Desulfofervidus auxilii]|uniref:RNA methyltransferase n=1 Tax=Desulfofervidus auxilii TaxID=1621989 RepID=A0A7C0Y1S2_DESA2|nr:RNA methyltransferase [Candidatus Desulfofervidus auxilii]